MDSQSNIGIPMYLSKDNNPKNLLSSTAVATMNSTIGPYIGTPMGIPRTSNYNSFQSMKTMNDVLFNAIGGAF